MTPIDFGYWLRGVMDANEFSSFENGMTVLKKAAEVLKLAPEKPAPPPLHRIGRPLFCVHNVHVAEWCERCGKNGRVFTFLLPADVKEVYINTHDNSTSRDAPDAPGSKAAEPAGDQGGETIAGAKIHGRES